ncbi:MAG TPA: DNA/RNA nuclease SfsA [Dehalococcoidia bacterium]|nr:DNA/RNA nuclease SfsA [Dehalococcoidia bacterium]
MKLPCPLVEAAIVERLNRFAVRVLVEGRETVAHLPNSGRLKELLQPGTAAYLVPRTGLNRKTAFDLLLVRLREGRRPGWVGYEGDVVISADARLPNALVAEALRHGTLPQFLGYPHVRPEARYGDSRCDFLLEGPSGRLLLEAKSVTWVEEGCGLFPDAPTERGRRHLQALREARRHGLAAAVVFVIQRHDAVAFRPCYECDPAFGHALREAAADGVAVYAYRCRVTLEEMAIAQEVAVEL